MKLSDVNYGLAFELEVFRGRVWLLASAACIALDAAAADADPRLRWYAMAAVHSLGIMSDAGANTWTELCVTWGI